MRRRRFATGGRPRINCPNGMVWINGQCMNVVPPPPGGHNVMSYGHHRGGTPIMPNMPGVTIESHRGGTPIMPNMPGVTIESSVSQGHNMAARRKSRPTYYRAGGRTRRYMHGGHAHGNRSCPGGYCGGGRAMSNGNGCGPGYHMMPDGTCMEGDYHGQYSNGYAHGGHISPGVGVCDGPSTAIDGFGNNIC